MLSKYYNKTAADALLDLKVKYADTTSMLSPYAIKSNTEASINTKVNITDTASMLSSYYNKTAADALLDLKVKYSDTASMLSPYAIKSNTEASINTKVNIADTASMLSKYYNKTAADALLDLKVKYADTTSMLSPYAIKSNTEASINTKVNITDTATMLSSYYNKTASDALLDLKVKYADTASILSPYAIKSNTEASINTKVNIADTASMLSKYYNKTAADALLDLKAPLASPTLTGIPTAPTASANDISTQIATTAFVAASITNSSTPDATTSSKGKLKLANDLGGTADAPTVNSVGGSSSSTIHTAELLANAATASNTGNAIVKRDVNGNFTAGTITADLLGTATNVTGIVLGANGGTGIDNTGKTITLGGNINTGGALNTTGTTASNASSITLKTTGATDLILPITGTLSTLDGNEQLSNKTINGLTPTSLATGFSIAGGTNSKTLTLTNNASLSGTNTGDQTISLTGDVTGTGSGTFSTTLSNSGVTAGTYGSATSVPTITVDAKGRVTNVANTTISGVSPVGSAMSSGKIIVGDVNNVASIVDMSGDVTIDNTGATLIGADKITTNKILNSNITYAKIQNVTTDKILGRVSTGNGIVEEVATTGTGDVVRAISPTFTGAPQVPTPIVSSNDNTIANTQFVTRAIGNISASSVSGVLPGANGGTGVDNTGKTITLGGNLTTSGANNLVLTTTGPTNVTFPTSGTLATLSDISGGSITSGQISGIIAPANGGTGVANNNTITLGGNLATGAAFTTTGTTGSNASAITLKTTAASTLVLPTSGTLATLDGTETLTNKIIAASVNTISGLTNSNLSGTAGITDANLATISTTGKVLNTATTATFSNTANAIVARDASGNFTAGTISASLAGNANTATKLATARTIYGNSFDGTANLGQVIASTYGGTGNGYTKFTGPTSSEKVFTLPDANATILTTDALITPAQGGTGVATAAANTVFAGPVSGINAAPTFRALTGADLPAGSGLYIANSTSQQANSSFNISNTGVVGGSLTAGSIVKQGGTSAQFLKADGSVDARSFATLTGSEALTNKSINGVTPTAVTTGFTIAGGLTNNKTLTVAADASVAGTNTGDVALTGQDYLSISNQTITASPVNLSGTNATGILAAARFPALTGDITNTAGAVATSISANAVTNTKIADNAVTTTKIADNAISSAKIATSAVTLDKIASISVQKLLGNKSSSAAGAPGEISIGAGLSLNATTGELSATGSGGTVTGTGTVGEMPYWSTTSGLASTPNFTWDNTNKIAKIGEGVNHANVDAYLITNMTTIPSLSVIGKVNDNTEQTLLRLKRVHYHGTSYAGIYDFVTTGGSGNFSRLDIRLNNPDNVNYRNLLSLENINGNVGINNITPTEKLDVAGSIRFSGALKPNNQSGTAGQFLTSQGAGTPTWTTFNGVTSIGSIASAANANGATITSGVLNLTPASEINGGVLTTGAQSISGMKRFFSPIVVNDNIQLNFSGAAGSGIEFTGDGDIVDNNDGYSTFRFTNGIKINNGNRSLGTTTNITLAGNGNIIAAGTIESTGLKMTTGAAAGKVLTSDANGVASWAAAATGIGGSGTASYIPKFNAASTILGNSNLFDDGTSVFVNSTSGAGGNKFVVNSGARLLPTNVASATTQTGGAFRIGNTSNDVMDMGAGVNNGWIQVADKLNLASNYALLLNPNGGNVGIGMTTNPTSKLQVNGDLAANSINGLVVKSNGSNVVLGQGNVLASLTTGANNVAVGQYTLNYLDAGSENLGMGYSAMYNTRGSKNIGLGHNALWTNNTGNNNTAIGHTAGYANTGSNNTFLGYQANSSGSITNATAIGNGAIVTADNTIQLGNTSVTTISTSGTFVSTSTNASSVAGKFVAGTNTAASASAVLEANSTTQGFLPPRMTMAQRDAIASPAKGLIIMCSDCGVTNGAQGEVQMHNGVGWRNIAGTQASGTTTGITAPAIGSSYQGGVVAYILAVGDPGYEAGKIKGFIVATADAPYFGRLTGGTNIAGITNTDLGIGGGLPNFEKLVAAYGTTNAGGVKTAFDYTVTENGVTYDDWYIPSKGEFLALYANRSAIGVLPTSTTYYWTSNQCNGASTAANYARYSDGFVQCNGTEQNGALRLIRNFTIDPQTSITATNFNGNATSATNIAGGTAGGLVYQSATGSTAFVTPGTSGQVLLSNGTAAPTWGSASATTLVGGAAGSMPYQSASGTTSFTAAGTTGQILTSTGTTAPVWTSVLSVAQGGTGTSTQNFVDLTTAQTVAGTKTFSSDIVRGGARIGLGGGSGGSDGRNIAMGINALAANTTGNWNVALGAYNLQASVTASNNVAVGNEVMGISAPGNDNTGVGNRSLFYNTGSNNTAIGSGSLNANTSGAGNTAVGQSAGTIITTGTNNTFIGKGANADNAARTNATAIGNGATVSADNTIQLGNTSVTSVNTSGAINAPIFASTPVVLTAGATITWTPLSGLNANVTLNANSTLSFGATPPAGSSGTLIITQPATGGPFSLTLPTVAGKTNKVLGSSSGILLSTTAGAKDILSFFYDGNDFYWNVGLGYGSTQNISANSLSGGVAGAIPYQTAANTTGFTAAGTTGQILTSTGTTAPSWTSVLSVAQGGTGTSTQNFIDLNTAQTIGGVKTFSSNIISNSVMIGKGAGQGNDNTAVGANALGTGTGARNTAIGYGALSGFTGTGFNNNTGIGYSNLSGLTTGYGNTSMGAETMASVGTGGENTVIGNQALRFATSSNNTVLGAAAGNIITTGSGNTIIGRGADLSSATLNYATAIGYGAIATADNTMQLGNTSLTNVKTSGTITAGTITYPNTAGTNGYVLTTNGTNTATWAAPTGAITGGTANAIPKYTSATAIGASSITDDGTTVSINNPVSFNNKTVSGASAAVNSIAAATTTYSLTQADNGKVINCNNTSALTITIPAGLTAGFNCMIVQMAAGSVTISGSGVTIYNRSNYTKTGGQYAIATIVSPSSNVFITGGDMQ